MKYITIILLFLCLMSCHNGRQSSCENVPVEKDSVQLRVIPVSISDTAYRNVDQTFEQISYVVLSDNVVIGEIVRTLVSDVLSWGKKDLSILVQDKEQNNE